MTPWNGRCALVLAGGGAEDPLARAHGVPSKALVPLAGQPLASYVLSALESAPQIARVVYVGEASGLPKHPEAVAPGGSSLSESLRHGLAASGGRPLLVLSADIPWLRPEGLRAFLAHAPEADLVYPIIPRAVAEAQFPGQRRTYAKNQLALARTVGPDILLKLLLRRASLPELEARVGRLLGARARAWISEDASLGADVDRPEHLAQGPALS